MARLGFGVAWGTKNVRPLVRPAHVFTYATFSRSTKYHNSSIAAQSRSSIPVFGPFATFERFFKRKIRAQSRNILEVKMPEIWVFLPAWKYESTCEGTHLYLFWFLLPLSPSFPTEYREKFNKIYEENEEKRVLYLRWWSLVFVSAECAKARHSTTPPTPPRLKKRTLLTTT